MNGRVIPCNPGMRVRLFPRFWERAQEKWWKGEDIPWKLDRGRAYNLDPVGGWGYFVGHWMEEGVSLRPWKEGVVYPGPSMKGWVIP